MIPISTEQSQSQFINTFDSNSTNNNANESDETSGRLKQKLNLNQMNSYGHLIVDENDFTSKKNSNNNNNSASKKTAISMLNQASTAMVVTKRHNDDLNDEYDNDEDQYDDDDNEEDYIDESESQSDEIDDQTYNLTGKMILLKKFYHNFLKWITIFFWSGVGNFKILYLLILSFY